ncbi:MAG: pyrroline-5-carboxylate reductase family protein, partial [Janthinobacterium lividum]
MSKTDLSGLGQVWLIGCGNMGGALLSRWQSCGLQDVIVIDPHPGEIAEARTSLPRTGDPEIVVLAVKPQAWLSATADLPSRLGPATVIVSVMAGITTRALAARFPGHAIIRTMPNTPARIGHGMTALYGHAADGAACRRADALMTAAGETVWLDKEPDFDAVTAVSGSGPAYLFAFIEALAAAAEASGLSPGLAAG